MNRKKKGWCIALGLMGGFLLLDLIWYGVTTVQYKPFVSAVPDFDGVHSLTQDGVSYTVETPGYLSYTGRLMIADKQAGLAVGVYPQLFQDDTYEVWIQEGVRGYLLDVNNCLELLEPYDEQQEILTRNKPEITRLMEQAKSVFPLD
ncbi:hypothetical protein D3D03_10505 [Exiguobacterium sp. RIT452]|uniref:hypothetical protein n=1 Tax=Exiguobacterium sp. RIT452 TaxID=2315552 RepID=UPI000E74A982|nr:hypothetical protein [Exiguobacterium sp. RIT452]RJO98146.1 hypothetical protein D3D03_10505 [Exiguobacterium sp. RIT452]